MAKSKALVPIFESSIVDPRQVDAMNALTSKRVPKNAIKTHPGKGGNIFTYVDHVWVTEMLQHGLGNLWNWEVLDYQVFTDSVAVRGSLTIYIPLDPLQRKTGDPLYITRTVTEIGSFDAGGGKMTTSNMIASAASRCLCRCVMRMFGIGIEFYKKEDAPMTANHAWTTLKEFAIKQGITWDDEFQAKFIAAMKAKGVTRENIVDKYADAYRILNTLLGKLKEVEEMPE
jgi:hypothetical protein